MKRTFIAGSLAPVAACAMLFSTPAMAHRVVHVEGSLFVIVCDPYGDAFTHVGNQTGAEEMGKLLCPTGLARPEPGADPARDWKVINARPTREALRDLPRLGGGGLPETGAKPSVSRKVPSGVDARSRHTPAHEAAHTVQQASGK